MYDILICRMMLWENSSRRHFLQLIVKTLKFNAGILKVTPLCVRFSRVSVFWFYFFFTLMHLDCAVSVFVCLYLASVFVLRMPFCVLFLFLCFVSMLCFTNISKTLDYHIVPKKSSKCRRVDTGSRDYNKFYESFVVPERVHVVPGWHPLIVKVWMLSEAKHAKRGWYAPTNCITDVPLCHDLSQRICLKFRRICSSQDWFDWVCFHYWKQ